MSLEKYNILKVLIREIYLVCLNFDYASFDTPNLKSIEIKN